MFSEAYRLEQLLFCSSSTTGTMIRFSFGSSIHLWQSWESLHKFHFRVLFLHRRDPFVKLIVAQVVKKFSTFHRTLSFITVEEKPTAFTLSWVILIQSTDFRHTSLISSLMPRSHERKSLLTGDFGSGFTTKNLCDFLTPPLHATYPECLFLFYLNAKMLMEKLWCVL
jgi:hypothetical protein